MVSMDRILLIMKPYWLSRRHPEPNRGGIFNFTCAAQFALHAI